MFGQFFFPMVDSTKEPKPSSQQSRNVNIYLDINNMLLICWMSDISKLCKCVVFGGQFNSQQQNKFFASIHFYLFIFFWEHF